MKKAVLMFAVLLCLSPKANALEKYAALTFDDGPSGEYTARLLEVLEQRGAKATFFLCGYRLAQYPDLAAQIIAGDHEVGLHGFSHKDMAPMSRRAIAQELMDTQALLPEKCCVRFFRPPGGQLSDGVVQVAKARGLAIALWSVDPRDWESRDAAAIGNHVIRATAAGDVVLMHDMSGSSIKAATAVIDRLQREGFQFVTLSELARLHRVRIHSGEIYRSFPPPETVK